MYTYIHINMYVYIYTYKHVCIYTHIYIYIEIEDPANRCSCFYRIPNLHWHQAVTLALAPGTS